jgi:nicotinamide-nucleotide amidase
MWFERNEKVFVSMPGVPHEMKNMMHEHIIPKLLRKFKTPNIHHTIIRTVGIGESFLAEKISAWEQSLPSHITLAYLPSLGEVKLRLTAFGADEKKLRAETEMLIEKIKPLAGEFIFGVGEDPLEVVLGNTLRDKKLTLAAAESCTGGFLSHLITSVAGSSDYFRGGIIPYNNEIKSGQLGVKAETLQKYGAVSEATITEMAEQVRLKFNSDIGVATSGIAGPGGGTAEKPVGTVWIACSYKDQTLTRKLQLSKDRPINIRVASISALNLIRISLLKNP